MSPGRALDGGPSSRLARFSLAAFTVAFVTVAGGFVVSAIYAELRAARMGAEGARMQTNSLPSIEHIAAAHSALRHVDLASNQYAEGASDEARRAAQVAVARARQEMDGELAAEYATPMYPGEAESAADTSRALDELDGRLAELYQLPPEGHEGVEGFLQRDVRDSSERVDIALRRLMSVNAVQGQAEVARITAVRDRSVGLALALDILCVSFATATMLVALHLTRRQRAIELAYERRLQDHVKELELFARRVAHDLLSPLSALAFTLSSVRRNTERGLPIAEPLERAGACLRRSRRLVDDVLDFARSSLAPASKGAARLREAIDGVRDDVLAESTGSEVIVEPFDDAVTVLCSAGVVASILSNLVRNAVKYMGDSEEKRVTVRVQAGERVVRVEVEDTGPGLPDGFAEHAFEPYVRAPENAQPGLGLGLATVRRFAEAHGGRAGVRPGATRGALFWFELPRASAFGGKEPAQGLEAALPLDASGHARHGGALD